MSQPKLSRPLLFTMSAAGGINVANLYFNQPLLDQMRDSLHISMQALGWIPSLTQIGYAIGMLFLVPLGDMRSRKNLIMIFMLLSVICLALTALAKTMILLAVASLALGLSTMTPQLLIPFAANLAPETGRGKVIGTMVSGLLLGILLARTVSGFIGAAFGWRAMFLIAAAASVVVMIVLAIVLPKSEPTFQGTYRGLLKSVYDIVCTQPALRESAFFGAMLFGAFSVFWATLIHLMETPAFKLGSRAVGIFGLLGAVGVFAAPWVGSLADKRDPRRSVGIMIAVTFLSFVIFIFSGTSLIGLGIGVLVMDIGVQAGHISNQSRIFALLPHARSRVQTVYMFCYFVGGAAGSWLGTLGWSQNQWTGVCLSAMGLLAVAGIRFMIPFKSAA